MKYYLLLLVLYSLLAHADIYSQVDQNGTLVYSDSPESPQAKKIDLPNQTTVPSSELPVATPPDLKKEKKQTLPAEQVNVPYLVFEISSPKDQESIQNQPLLHVTVNIDPALQQGDSIQINLDGKPLGPPANSTQFDFTAPERGIHKLSAQIIDANGNLVRATSDLTIYVHQAHVGGPALSSS